MATTRAVKAKNIRTTILEPIGDVLVHGAVRIYFAKISPISAARFIDPDKGLNAQNRTVNAGHVDRLTAEMSGGHWRVTHQGIAFDSDGILIDGQHRMTAIVASGKPQTFIVSEGWEPVNRVATDTGYMRQLRDALKIMGVTGRPSLVAAVLNGIQRYAIRDNIKLSFERSKILIDRYRAGIAWAEGKVPQGRGRSLTSGAVVSAFVYAYPRAAGCIDRAWDDLISGAISDKNDPILRLRDEIHGNRNLGSDGVRVEIFNKTLNALHQRMNKRPCKVLKESAQASAFFAEAYGA